jgi:SAM-dependent methyltransferase
MTDRLYEDGRHYDRMFPHEEDIGFFVEQARASGGSVLELACGTGRILQPIADAGLSTTGIDLSAAMLVEAKRRAHSRAASPRYIDADMTSFHLDERFALIFLANNALCHLLDIDAFHACMTCVRQHLADGGRFIVDVFVPSMPLLLADPDKRRPMAEYDDPDGGGRVVVTLQARYDPITQINAVKTFQKFPGDDVEREGSLDMRMYFPQELQALLRYNGMRVVAAYGDYDKAPLSGASQRQILVCSRR